MLGAIDLDWSLLANLGAALGGLAILLGAFGLLNLARGRPFWSLPQDVGPAELAAFVLVPAALPLIFGGQWGSALVTAAANLLLLALAFGVIRYGLFAIVRWTGARLFEQLAASLSVISRAVPLLLVFALVLFINTEMWQVFSRMPDAFLVLVGVLFVLAGSVFVAAQLPREVRELEEGAGSAGPPLENPQRFNVGLVMFVGQALQILVVSLAIGAFFVVFGALAVGPDVREAWEVDREGVVLQLHAVRRAGPGDGGAPAGVGRDRGVRRPLLRDRGAHRLDLPPGVPRRADRGDGGQLRRPGRVPGAAEGLAPADPQHPHGGRAPAEQTGRPPHAHSPHAPVEHHAAVAG